jgi:hypothetical protein
MNSTDKDWLLVMLAGRLGSLRNEAAKIRATAQLEPELLRIADAYEKDAASCRRIIAWIEKDMFVVTRMRKELNDAKEEVDRLFAENETMRPVYEDTKEDAADAHDLDAVEEFARKITASNPPEAARSLARTLRAAIDHGYFAMGDEGNPLVLTPRGGNTKSWEFSTAVERIEAWDFIDQQRLHRRQKQR